MARVFTRPEGRIALVRNRSSRRGVLPSKVVIHTTESHEREGRSDVDGIRNFFDNPAAEASSHVIIDAEAHSTTCVPDDEKAWTVGSENPYTLNIELIGWAKTPRWQWLKRTRQLKKAAKFTAYWSKKYGIPLRLDKRRGMPGVCGHVHLSGPGGHWDPGPGFPYDRFLRYARYYRQHGWVQ